MEFADARKYRRQVRRLYNGAFPAEERMPIRYLYRGTRKTGDFRAVLDKDGFAGLFYVIEYKRLAYIFYLAVEEDLRGRGYGTEILESLKARYGDRTVILNIEDPFDETADNAAVRRRRLGFYERNGFADTGIKTEEFGVVYELLCASGTVTLGEYLEMMEHFMGRRRFRFTFRGTLDKLERS